jgi:DNA polymerase I
VVDWLSLVGDAVDNIPGAPGVGAKTAADLLIQFDSIAALIERAGEVRSERVRRSIETSVELLRRNQDLIRLREHRDIPASLDELAVRPPDTGELRRLYTAWGFRKLLAELDATPLLL